MIHNILLSIFIAYQWGHYWKIHLKLFFPSRTVRICISLSYEIEWINQYCLWIKDGFIHKKKDLSWTTKKINNQVLKNKGLNRKEYEILSMIISYKTNELCQRSSYPFDIISYDNWVTTSWTCSKNHLYLNKCTRLFII